MWVIYIEWSIKLSFILILVRFFDFSHFSTPGRTVDGPLSWTLLCSMTLAAAARNKTAKILFLHDNNRRTTGYIYSSVILCVARAFVWLFLIFPSTLTAAARTGHSESGEEVSRGVFSLARSASFRIHVITVGVKWDSEKWTFALWIDGVELEICWVCCCCCSCRNQQSGWVETWINFNTFLSRSTSNSLVGWLI